MDYSILGLTRKDSNGQPIGSLVADMRYVKRITSANNLHSFSFDLKGHEKLDFMLVSGDCTTFFRLLTS
jgi:hypothetical protein